MAGDALDPGDAGTFPFFPRLMDGSPAWSDSAATDGVPVAGRGPGGLVTPMPRGIRYVRRGGQSVMVDVTPMAGTLPVNPPVLP